MNRPLNLSVRLLSSAAIILFLAGSAGMQGCVDARGRDVYINMGCPQCHGLNGEGLVQGPSLKNLSRHWTKAELISYVENPSEVVAVNPRLQDLAKRYVTRMPSFMINPEAKRQLADYLLSLE